MQHALSRRPIFYVLMLAFGLSAAPAFAQSMSALVPLNVRAGPGLDYPIVDRLYRNERVLMGDCTKDGWCQISHPGPKGWVEATYLTSGQHLQTWQATSRPTSPTLTNDTAGALDNMNIGINLDVAKP